MFADRIQGANGEAAAWAVVQKVRKALVLSPDERSMRKARGALAGDLPVFDKSDIEQSMVPFAREREALLMLTNRYDGIDLPGSDCQLVVLDQLPSGVHLLERFIVNTLGARRVLQERIRTRIVQGAGRCTRSPSDYAVVLVSGADITNFCGQGEVQRAMHPALQVELAFGWDNSRVGLQQAVERVASFISQDPAWAQEVDPHLNQERARTQKQLPASAAKFGSAAPFEVRAVDAAWNGDWPKAVELARAAADRLDNEPDCREYRSLLLYLGGQWAIIGGRESGRAEMRDLAARLIQDATRAAPKSGWMNQPVPVEPGLADEASEELIRSAAGHFAAIALEKPVHFEGICVALENRLNATASVEFEMALVQLGQLLGFTSARHVEDAAPDTEWTTSSGGWIVFEAKSDEAPQGEIGASAIRQANSHPQWAAQTRGTTVPPGTVSVLLTPRNRVSTTNASLAGDYVRVADLETVRELSRDSIAAWREIRGNAVGLSGDELVTVIRDRFRRNGVLGHDVFRRLGARHPRDLAREPAPSTGPTP